jgi:hypothetical protein
MEDLYPAVSPLGRALRQIAKKTRLSSLDVPVLEDAATALDGYNEWWVYTSGFLDFMESAHVDLPPDLAARAAEHIRHLKQLRKKLKGK